MNEIPVQEFTAALAAHAESVGAGPAPIDEVLAGARRRAVRRRAAVAVAGAAVIVGVAGGLGAAFGGSHGPRTQQVPPGQRSSAPGVSDSSLSDSSPHGSPRHIPAFTQQDGRGTVAASGVEDGLPWQVSITDRTAPDGSRTIGMVLMKGGGVAESTSIGSDPGGKLIAPMVLVQGPDSAWVFLVPPDITDVAWIGTDGFRHDQATLSARPYGSLGELRLAVFPSTRMNVQVGDEFVGYDASGRQVALLGMLSATPT